MKNQTKTAPVSVSVVSAIRELTPRGQLDRKAFADFYKGAKQILQVVYEVYHKREHGNSTPEFESEAMKKVTDFLHTLGKANGKYISVCEKTKDADGRQVVLFDTLVYHSFADTTATTSIVLASLEAKLATASKEKAVAHKAMLDGKGTLSAYKKAVATYNSLVEQVKEERAKQGTERAIIKRASQGKFTTFLIRRLKAIIENRFSMSEEQMAEERKARNQAAKARRTTAKSGSKKTTAKKTTAPTTESGSKKKSA